MEVSFPVFKRKRKWLAGIRIVSYSFEGMLFILSNVLIECECSALLFQLSAWNLSYLWVQIGQLWRLFFIYCIDSCTNSKGFIIK